MMVYSPDCFYDSKWAYLCSHDVSRQLGEGGLSDEANEKSLTGKPDALGGNAVKREIFDRLSGIVDTEDARFQKLKQDNFKFWEQSVASLCKSINKGVDLFYQGNLKVLKFILESQVDNRDDYIPQVCEQDFSPDQAANASAPYVFQSLPLTGTKIDASFTDDHKLRALQEKLSSCNPLALWHEPIDIANNGPEFIEGLIDLLLATARTFKEKGQSLSAEQQSHLQSLHSYSIQCLYGIAILSGNHDTVIHALKTISDYDKLVRHDEKFAKAVFAGCQETLGKFLTQVKTVRDQQKPLYHCMQGANLSGVFGIAKQFVLSGMNERNTSITTDDTFLYVYVSIQSRSFMMKIVTGENGSVAGRVITVETNDTSEVTWVYCKGKLYSKKISDPFGLLNVHDPETLQIQGQVKLCVNEIFQNPKLSEGLNRNYPLLSDGESLFIVTVQVVQKNKSVREELKAEFEVLKTKIKSDATKKAAEKTSKDASKDASPAPKEAPQKGEKKSAKEQQEEKAQMLEKLKKDKHEARAEARKKRAEHKKEPAKKEEAPKAQEKTELKAYQDIDIYRVCEFSVHQFDLEPSQTHKQQELMNQPDHVLFQEPLCLEMYQAFSGLFSVKDCARALKFNNDDIETAVQWLIDEKSRPEKENVLAAKKSQVIYESLVQVYNQVSNTNVDVQVVNSSLLHPHNITTGKWTLANGQVSFHNVGQDNEVISVFSLEGSNFKQVHADRMLKTFQIPQNLFEKNDFTQHYFDGKEWKCYTMQEICEKIATIKSLLPADQDGTSKSDLGPFFSPEGFLSELQLYEPIKLHGTLLTHINSPQRTSSLHTYSNSYITYSPGNKKFYVMIFNGKDKNIAVVEDPAAMLPKTMSEPTFEFNDLTEFVNQSLQWLTFANESRFQMPWRWRLWSQFYTNAIQEAENFRGDMPTVNKLNINPLSGLPDSTPEKLDDLAHAESQEAKKTLVKKLQKRQKKLTQREMQIELSKFGLSTLSLKEAQEYAVKAEKQRKERADWNEKQVKQKQKAAPSQPMTIPVNAPVPQLKKSNAQVELDKPKPFPPPGGFGGYGGLFGDKKPFDEGLRPIPGQLGSSGFCPECTYQNRPGASNCRNCDAVLQNNNEFGKLPPPQHNPFSQTQNFFPPQPQGQYALPSEQICVARENKKVHAFCPSGSVEALEAVFRMLKEDGDNTVILRAMLDQVTFADNLSAYHNEALLTEISKYLLATLPTASEQTAQFLWRILIVGWYLFIRTQHAQLQAMALIVDQSRRANFSAPPNSMLECLTRVTATVAPICLFATRFLSLQSFYPLEFVSMSKVTAQLVVCMSEQVYLPKTQANQAKIEQADQAANESGKVFTPIKQAYARPYNSERNFKNYSKVDQSVTSMPLDILTFRAAKSGSGLFGGSADSYTFRSQSYFAMPIHCALMSELVSMSIFNETAPQNLDQLLSWYSTELPESSESLSHKQKYDFFMDQRVKSAKLQEELFSQFASAILQSLSETSEHEDGQFAWDNHVSVALFRSFSHLIVQAMTSFSWQMPFNTDLMIKSVKFVEEAILLLSKKTANFTKKFSAHHVKWLRELHRFAQNLVNMLHLSLGSTSQAYLSVKILPSLMTILDQFRRIFNFADGKSKSDQPERNMLDVHHATNTEGVDATYEHIWETAHPYPKQEMRQTELVRVSKAIGYFVELDPRCTTNGHNDYVQLKSQEQEFQIGNQVGTKFRFSGRVSSGNHTFILIGKQLEIEFRVSAVRNDRGRRPPGDGNQPKQDDRWGFRMTILPIFTTPGFSPDKAIKKKSCDVIYSRLGLDGQLEGSVLYSWFIFFIMTVYVASAFTQDLTDKNMFKQTTGTKIDTEALHFPDDSTQKLKSKDPKRNKEQSQIKNIMSSDVLNWHLLKGGLNLQFAKQNNAVTDMDTYLHECLDRLNSQNCFNVQLQQQLKELAEPQSEEKAKKSIEPALMKKQASLVRQQTMVKEQVKEFVPNKESWPQEIRELVDKYDVPGETLDLVLKKIRSFRFYEQGFKGLQMKGSFRPFIPLWQSVERLLIAAMLYHSDSLSDIKKFLDFDPYQEELSKEQVFLKDQFTTIGGQLNVVIRWMTGRLTGAQELKFIAEWIFEKAQEVIDAEHATKVEKDRIACEQKLMADEDAAAALLRENQKAEQERKLAEEKVKEEIKKEEPKPKKAAVVSVSKNKAPANKGKRANRPQLARVLPKPQDKKKKPVVEVKEDRKKEEEQKHPEEVEKEVEQEPEYLEMDDNQLKSIRDKIEKETLDYLKELLAPSDGKAKKLSELALFFDIELDISDVHNMVTKIFKQIKRQIEKVIDLDDPTAPILRKLDVEKFEHGKPEEQVAKEINNRTLLLFEINNSVSFLSEVTKIDNLQRLNSFWRGKRMATILEELEEDQTSQQQIFTEISEGLEQDADNFSNDSDADLQPIAPTRSYSVPTTTSTKFAKTPFSSLGAPGAQNERAMEQRKQSMDYSDFVETYRKWRLWNKKGEDEPELLSPFGSPLLSVVQFVKCSKIQDPSLLRNIMIDQQQLALFRLYGLQMQEKLFHLFGHSPFGRYVWGNHSTTLQESTLHSVETCGERLTKQLNVCSRNLVQLLMDRFTYTVRSCLQKDAERAAIFKEYKKVKSDDKNGAKQMSSKNKEEAFVSLIIEDLKKILLLLNDIRVLMNNIYTREHVLESLRQDNKLSTQDSLGIDKIQSFLKSVVEFLIIANASINGARAGNAKSLWSINKLKVNITHVAKLVLNLFISQDKIMIRQTETQRILQEMLLDITVDQLESKCYKVVNGKIESRLTGGNNQSHQVQLLKLLCEVIKISNDTNNAYQADVKESGEQEAAEVVHQPETKVYFLSAGSQKVIRCATLLAYMLHNVEVPSVMRLTIKCASLLFKLLDLKKLKLPNASALESIVKGSVKNEFLIETLKTIGQKIGNVPSVRPLAPSKPVEEVEAPVSEVEEAKDSPPQAEIKEEVVEQAEAKSSSQDQFYVICNLNTPEQEDFIFIFTALVHWYLRYPNKSLKLIADPSEITQVPKPDTKAQEAKKEEKKQDPPVEDGKAKPDEKLVEKPAEAKPEGEKVPEKLPEIVKPNPGDIAKSLQMMFSEKAEVKEAEKMLEEIAAIEEESKIVELAQKLAVDGVSSEEQQEILSLELAQKLDEIEEAKEAAKALAELAKAAKSPVLSAEASPKSVKAAEEKKHSEEVDKVDADGKKAQLRPIDEYKELLPEIIVIQNWARKWLDCLIS